MNNLHFSFIKCDWILLQSGFKLIENASKHEYNAIVIWNSQQILMNLDFGFKPTENASKHKYNAIAVWNSQQIFMNLDFEWI